MFLHTPPGKRQRALQFSKTHPIMTQGYTDVPSVPEGYGQGVLGGMMRAMGATENVALFCHPGTPIGKHPGGILVIGPQEIVSEPPNYSRPRGFRMDPGGFGRVPMGGTPNSEAFRAQNATFDPPVGYVSDEITTRMYVPAMKRT